MSYTLKIRWERHERFPAPDSTQGSIDPESFVGVRFHVNALPAHFSASAGESDGTRTASVAMAQLVDAAEHFIPCRRVTVHQRDDSLGEPDLSEWGELDYADYRHIVYSDHNLGPGETPLRHEPGLLIEYETIDGDFEFVLATKAWLLGPDGQTVERLAP